MPRRQRQKSKKGIYHVMIRGINKQFIFHDELDFIKMETILRVISAVNTESKRRACAIYAYCLMGNHMHLLIEQMDDTIDVVMKRIGVSYVSYYNKRYDRVGPLFQGRFKSESVDSFEYFVTLLHYIHMNPVVANLVSNPEDYRWSSWREYASDTYTGTSSICSVVNAFGNITRDQLRQIVINPDESVQTAIDPESMTDNEAGQCVKSLLPRDLEIQKLSELTKKERDEYLLKALQAGIGVRQLVRITGIGRSVIARINRKT